MQSPAPQKGFTHVLVLIILLLGIAAGVYLVKTSQIFKTKAIGVDPVVLLDNTNANTYSYGSSGQILKKDSQGNYVSTSKTVRVHISVPSR